MPLVQVDASQLEWRAALELSRDEVGIAEVLKGDDTHSLNEKAFELPSRLVAKKYLFRTIFRGNGWSFANDPEFLHVSSSAKYWDNVNELFYKKYEGLNKQHHVWKDLVLSSRPIVGPLGREWLIPIKQQAGVEFKIPWTILSNYPVQGTGADIMLIARISAARRLAHLPVKLITTVHDSLIVDSPPEHVQECINIFHQVFDDLQKNIRRLFKYEWIVPLACETKVGPNMKDMIKQGRTG